MLTFSCYLSGDVRRTAVVATDCGRGSIGLPRHCAEYRNISGCNADVSCEWNRIVHGCGVVCEQLQDAVECIVDAGAGCRLDVMNCTRRCAFRYTSEVPCMDDPSCVWAGSMCVDTCAKCTSADCCYANTLCNWENAQCVGLCGVHATELACAADTRGCVFNWNLQRCEDRVFGK